MPAKRQSTKPTPAEWLACARELEANDDRLRQAALFVVDNLTAAVPQRYLAALACLALAELERRAEAE